MSNTPDVGGSFVRVRESIREKIASIPAVDYNGNVIEGQQLHRYPVGVVTPIEGERENE